VGKVPLLPREGNMPYLSERHPRTGRNPYEGALHPGTSTGNSDRYGIDLNLPF
jgi:hypothetical protein